MASFPSNPAARCSARVLGRMQPIAPHWVEVLLDFAAWYLAPIVSFLISVVYYRASGGQVTPLWRVVISAHGVTITLIYIGATVVALSGHADLRLGPVFTWALVAPLTSMIAALVKFKGRKMTHLLLVPNLACLLWVGFIGGMAITGDWL